MSDQKNKRTLSAGLVVIGNEILSGRTQDVHTRYLAEKLNARGIALKEVRVIPDSENKIIEAVRALRDELDYVFTTGGIGPTHDDITAASVARAFNVPLEENKQAMAMLEAHYTPRGETVTPARAKMAQIPRGAALIPNTVSGAPGFQIGNVYVMAGVPAIMQDMFSRIAGGLAKGALVHSVEIPTDFPESLLAEKLDALQRRFPSVEIGSYPHQDDGHWQANIVLKSSDEKTLKKCRAALDDILSSLPEDFAETAP